MKTEAKKDKVKKPSMLDGKPVPEQDWSNPDAPINHGEKLADDIPAFVPETKADHQGENDSETPQEISAELDGFIEDETPPENKGETKADNVVDLPSIKKSDVETAEDTAAGALIILTQALSAFGINSHIDEAAAQEWAKGVAPVMAKYNLLPSFDAGKWSVEVTALKATAMLGFGVYMGIAQDKAQKAAQAEQQAQAKAA